MQLHPSLFLIRLPALAPLEVKTRQWIRQKIYRQNVLIQSKQTASTYSFKQQDYNCCGSNVSGFDLMDVPLALTLSLYGKYVSNSLQ